MISFNNLSRVGFVKLGKGKYKYSRFISWSSVGYAVTENQKSLISRSAYKAYRSVLLGLIVINISGGMSGVSVWYGLLATLAVAIYFGCRHEKYVSSILSKCEMVIDERSFSKRYGDHLKSYARNLPYRQGVILFFTAVCMLLLFAYPAIYFSDKSVWLRILSAGVALLALLNIFLVAILFSIKRTLERSGSE